MERPRSLDFLVVQSETVHGRRMTNKMWPQQQIEEERDEKERGMDSFLLH